MFFNFFLKSFRILLFPFALLYWLGIAVRNWLYDRRVFPATGFGLPLVGVGNLSVGGTGKSPMIEYLLELLAPQFNVATLSRGYKRKTRGYALAGDTTTALEIGDEPMQFHLKFPQVPVAVGEKRVEAVPQLLHDHPETQVILLDDAFQHRAIKAGLDILLTDCNNLYTRDFYLPTGDLRDQRLSRRRAQIIVVTKCQPDLSEKEKQALLKEIAPLPGQAVFFTAIDYGIPYHITNRTTTTLGLDKEVLLVTGIANPAPLKHFVEDNSKSYSLLPYSDHHIFSIDDLNEIKKRFQRMEATDKIILTTEKDAVRLVKFNTAIAAIPVYVLPVRPVFLFGEGEQFNQHIIQFIKGFKSPL